MSGFKTIAHKTLNIFLALFIITAQLFTPISALVPKAYAASPQIIYNNFEGEIAPQNSNNWTNGNISGYKEGDTVRFRVDLDSDAGSLNGSLSIGFTSDPSCRFFKYQNPTNIALDFNRATNTIDAGSGFTASFVSLSQVGSDAVANFNLGSTTASSVRLNFTLQLDDNAAVCATGSSQHVEAQNATGDVKSSGNKALPIPSTAVAPVTDITVAKSGTATASIGGGVSYTITVNNLDLTPASAVVVTDVVPNGITPTTATFDVDPLSTGETGNCTISSQTVTCNLGTLGGNDSNTTAPEADKAIITITGTVNNNTLLCGTTLINNVSVTTTTLESNSNNNSASASTQINPCLGSLTVIKNVINDNGGQLTASSFNVHVKSGGNDITGSPSAGSETGTTYNVGAGTYTISEDTPPTGYAQTSIVCNGQATNTVTVTLNSTNSCTITNNDIAPSLTLNKIVSNTHGGTATESNWTLTATGPTTISGAGANGSTDVVSGATFSTGTYTLSESTGPIGYSANVWTCTNNVTVTNNQITLGNGQTTICSITNSDVAPTLTVIKHMINDNGGTSLSSAFSMIITGTNVANSSFAGSESPGTTTTLNAGSYSVGETGPAGYAATYSTDCSGTIALGETKVCTVTNNDISPTLQLIKSVINNNGGTAVATDWNLTATASTNTVGATTQSGAGGFGPTNVYAGVQYTLTETGLSGYTPGTWGCIGGSLLGNILTLALDDDAVCTITNNDNPPILHLRKVITNNNGGTATLADFTLTANGTTGTNDISGTSPVDSGATLLADTFALSETNPGGYTASAWVCTGNGTQNGANITLGLGQEATCTITNDDVAPSLTLNKIVSNTHGGSAVESAWTLTASGPTPLSGAGASGNTDVVSGSTFSAGTYTLSESAGSAGYTPSVWTCSNNVSVNGNSQITLANGQTTVCTITNSDIAPSLTVTKVVLNPYGDPLLASAFPLFVDSTAVTSGVSTTQFNAGTHTITETQQTGYLLSGISGDCTQTEGIISVLLQLAGASTCTLTNTAIQPKIIVIKHVINDNGGSKTASNFTMTVSGNSATVPNFAGAESPGTTVNLNEGSYSVDELADSGYAKSLSTDCTGTITIGQTKTCTVTNDDISPTLTVVKDIVSTQADSGKFNLKIDGTTAGTGGNVGDNGTTGAVPVNAGQHSVSESAGTSTSLDDYVTTYGGDCDKDGNITLTLAQNATCTITNTRKGSITIVKNADPDSSQEFKFTGSLGDSSETEGPIFTLVDDGVGPGVGQRTFSPLVAKQYTVNEPSIHGWTLESVTCTDGSDTDTHNRNAVIDLQPGENVTCTFLNTRDTGSITVTKITNPSPDEDESDFTILLRDDTEANDIVHTSILSDGESDTYEVVTDDYNLSEEFIPDGWDLADAYCTRDEGRTKFDPRDGSFSILKDDDLGCVFTNHKRAEVTVTKYNDFDRDGAQDTDEPTLEGWTFELVENLGEAGTIIVDTQTTGPDGKATFSNVLPGSRSYNVRELEDKGAEWQITGFNCGEFGEQGQGEVLGVTPEPGQTIDCQFFNAHDAVLNLTKSNNRPAPTTVGDTVTYTLVVTVPDDSGAVFDTTVQDLPPEGFNYVAGSWTANSSIRGNILNSPTTEPSYGSPGTWLLGTMLPGEVVTLTYRALIANSASAGTYPDIAFATGCDRPTEVDCELSLLANVQDEDDSPFVATNVTIKSPQVLGANTTVLVDTGVGDVWRNMMVGTLLMGLGMATLVRRQKKGAQL